MHRAGIMEKARAQYLMIGLYITAAICIFITQASITCELITDYYGNSYFRYYECESGIDLTVIYYVCLISILSLGIRGRSALRLKYGIPGNSCGDVLMWCCCSSCAVAQEAHYVDTQVAQLPTASTEICWHPTTPFNGLSA